MAGNELSKKTSSFALGILGMPFGVALVLFAGPFLVYWSESLGKITLWQNSALGAVLFEFEKATGLNEWAGLKILGFLAFFLGIILLSKLFTSFIGLFSVLPVIGFVFSGIKNAVGLTALVAAFLVSLFATIALTLFFILANMGLV